MKLRTLVLISICLLTLLASGPDSKNIARSAAAGTCPSKDCGPTLPWYDFDPACCLDMRPPHHIYQKANRNKVEPGMVRCLERLQICSSKYEITSVVDEKKGCQKDAFWHVPEGTMVCCTAWDNAIKTGKPCDPAKSPNCTGLPPAKNDFPFSSIDYISKNKPDFVWVSAAAGNAKVFDCDGTPFQKVIGTENNGTMLKVVDRVDYGGTSGHAYAVKGERGGGSYTGCMRPEDVACDPAKVRK